MSRNIGYTHCKVCSSEHVRLEEPEHPITKAECNGYDHEYMGRLTVAKASCADCGTRYLAWCSRPSQNYHSSDYDRGFYDLSFRASFDDEPHASDLPSVMVLRMIADRDRELHVLALESGLEQEIRSRRTAITVAQASIGTPSYWETYLKP